RAAAMRAAQEAEIRLAAQLQAARSSGAAGAAAGGAGGGVKGPALRGSARITELSDASDPQMLAAFMQAWRAQPSFAVAVISSRPLALEPELRQQQQQQLGMATAGTTGGGLASSAVGRVAAPDGSRSSAVDACLTVPGPPCAAVLQQHNPHAAAWGNAGASPGTDGVREAPAELKGGQGQRQQQRRRQHGSAAQVAEVDGLVVTWSHTEAVVLTFTGSAHSESTEGDSSAGDEAAGVGGKRKAAAQLPRPAKTGGKPPAAAARAGAGSEEDAGRGEVPHADKASGGATSGNARTASALWRAACEVLGAAASCKVCWHAEAQLAALMAAGCDPAGQWDDPQVMAWMAQGTAGPQEFTLPELQRSVLPAYAVRVPLQHRAAATAACRTALGAWALAPPLRAMMAAEGAATHYRLVEAPLTLELARSRLHLLGRHQTAQPAPASPPQQPPPPYVSSAAGNPAASTAAALAAAAGRQEVDPQASSTSHRASSGTAGMQATNAGVSPLPKFACGGLTLNEAACRSELSRMTASQDACERLVSHILGQPVDLSQPATLEALCAREYLHRRPGVLPPDLQVQCPMGRRQPRFQAFYARAGLPPRERARAEALSALLTRHAAATEMAAALRALLAASEEAEAAAPAAAAAKEGCRDPAARTAGGSDRELSPEPGRNGVEAAVYPAGGSGAVAAAVPESGCGGAARFALHRAGVHGRLGFVFCQDAGNAAGPAAATASASDAADAAAAADGLVVVGELSSAPVPAPSLQQQYCSSAEGERYLQGQLPLPVLFLDSPLPPDPHPGQHPPHPPPGP
ncbi:hypothetical protein Agub_g6675, partial [Astrephomene gubernaculifera]